MSSLQGIEARERVEAAPRPTGGGVSLERLLELGPLLPAEAVALAFALFMEIQRLESRGLQHGAVSGRNVLVRNDGSVALLSPVAPPRGELEVGDDVRAAGELICAALGMSDARGEHGDAPVELSNPDLAVAARALSQGALGRSSQVAATGFRARVPALADASRLADSRLEIGRLVVRAESGGLRRSIPPAAPAPALAAAPALARPLAGDGRRERPSRRRPLALGATLAVAAFLTGVGLAAISQGLWPGASSSVAGPESAPSAGPESPAGPVATTVQPVRPASRPLPVYGPPAAGGLTGIDAAALQPCSTGRTCSLQISMRYGPLVGRPDFAWEVHAFDRCSGSDQIVGAGSFAAPAGWNHIQVVTPAWVPPGLHSPVLVAVSTRPERVASNPLELTAVAC